MGGCPVGYLQSMDELNLGPANRNLSGAREEDLNSGSLDYKSSALINRPCCLQNKNYKYLMFGIAASDYLPGTTE